MKRAAVIIGVDRTGGLPPLNDAAKGARRIEAWAKSQGIQPVTLTDENGRRVELRQIKRSIDEIVDRGADQLIVYFAGHGINVGENERWLLSGAPRDADEAVNVNGSAGNALWCGIPHVVFISDACRTAAQTIRMQVIVGGHVFPNLNPSGPEQAVDKFWACGPGSAAIEVKDQARNEYRAVYTEALLRGFNTGYADLVDVVTAPEGMYRLIRPLKLKRFLVKEVPRQHKKLLPGVPLNQVPDARIASDETAWIARLDGEPPATRGVSKLPPDEGPAAASRTLVASILGGTAAVVGDASLSRAAADLGAPFRPDHYEMDCGFKVRGAVVVAVTVSPRHAQAVLLEGSSGGLVRVTSADLGGVSVALRLADGSGVLLPAVPEFLAALTFDDGGLVHVAYEPSTSSHHWQSYTQQAGELRQLQTIAAAASRLGVFRLEQDDATKIARRMQILKGIDPALAVYAAHAYAGTGRRMWLIEMRDYMRWKLGLVLFDIGLLSGQLDRQQVSGRDACLLPCVPLLTQGWDHLGARGVRLPPGLGGLVENLLPSVWTLFDADGMDRIEAALKRGEIR
ncbi:caspase family protein [Nannocystis pusilla]|uniref:caspase family protein n=1 Tax=Nannocystis pusilla TaxID=889268 RepID=UPI003BF2E3AA